MADANNCRTCNYRESGDDAYHCYMFKVEPEPLCMQHQDRKPKRVGTIGHVGGRTSLITAVVATILAQQAKDEAGVSVPAAKASDGPLGAVS